MVDQDGTVDAFILLQESNDVEGAVDDGVCVGGVSFHVSVGEELEVEVCEVDLGHACEMLIDALAEGFDFA